MWERFSSWRTQTTAERNSRLQDHKTQLLHLNVQVHLRWQFEIFMYIYTSGGRCNSQWLYTSTFNPFLLSVGMEPRTLVSLQEIMVFQSVRNSKTSMSHYLCLHDCIFIQTITWINLLVDKWIGWSLMFLRGKRVV